MSNNVISLDSRRPSPWKATEGCDCAACQVQRMGHDLDRRLTAAATLLDADVEDAMRHYLQQLADLTGVDCQYERRAQS